MNNRTALFFQATRGPILLITLGILFAIHQAGGFPIYRTWPLLIIVVGVMKLMERTASSGSGAYPPPPPSGGPVR
ncbi:MAG: hypothetical protein ACJ74Y_04465 [Bryobacteraceae bacterium]